MYIQIFFHLIYRLRQRNGRL